LLNYLPVFRKAVSDEDISIVINRFQLLFCQLQLSVLYISKKTSDKDIKGIKKRAS